MSEAFKEMQGLTQRVHKSLECAICLEILAEPFSTQCNHQFCRKCLDQLLSRRKRKSDVLCPLCKSKISKRGLTKNEKLGGIVDAVRNVLDAIDEDFTSFQINDAKVKSPTGFSPKDTSPNAKSRSVYKGDTQKACFNQTEVQKLKKNEEKHGEKALKDETAELLEAFETASLGRRKRKPRKLKDKTLPNPNNDAISGTENDVKTRLVYEETCDPSKDGDTATASQQYIVSDHNNVQNHLVVFEDEVLPEKEAMDTVYVVAETPLLPRPTDEDQLESKQPLTVLHSNESNLKPEEVKKRKVSPFALLDSQKEFQQQKVSKGFDFYEDDSKDLYERIKSRSRKYSVKGKENNQKEIKEIVIEGKENKNEVVVKGSKRGLKKKEKIELVNDRILDCHRNDNVKSGKKTGMKSKTKSKRKPFNRNTRFADVSVASSSQIIDSDSTQKSDIKDSITQVVLEQENDTTSSSSIQTQPEQDNKPKQTLPKQLTNSNQSPLQQSNSSENIQCEQVNNPCQTLPAQNDAKNHIPLIENNDSSQTLLKQSRMSDQTQLEQNNKPDQALSDKENTSKQTLLEQNHKSNITSTELNDYSNPVLLEQDNSSSQTQLEQNVRSGQTLLDQNYKSEQNLVELNYKTDKTFLDRDSNSAPILNGVSPGAPQEDISKLSQLSVVYNVDKNVQTGVCSEKVKPKSIYSQLNSDMEVVSASVSSSHESCNYVINPMAHMISHSDKLKCNDWDMELNREQQKSSLVNGDHIGPKSKIQDKRDDDDDLLSSDLKEASGNVKGEAPDKNDQSNNAIGIVEADVVEDKECTLTCVTEAVVSTQDVFTDQNCDLQNVENNNKDTADVIQSSLSSVDLFTSHTVTTNFTENTQFESQNASKHVVSSNKKATSSSELSQESVSLLKASVVLNRSVDDQLDASVTEIRLREETICEDQLQVANNISRNASQVSKTVSEMNEVVGSNQPFTLSEVISKEKEQRNEIESDNVLMKTDLQVTKTGKNLESLEARAVANDVYNTPKSSNVNKQSTAGKFSNVSFRRDSGVDGNLFPEKEDCIFCTGCRRAMRQKPVEVLALVQNALNIAKREYGELIAKKRHSVSYLSRCSVAQFEKRKVKSLDGNNITASRGSPKEISIFELNLDRSIEILENQEEASWKASCGSQRKSSSRQLNEDGVVKIAGIKQSSKRVCLGSLEESLAKKLNGQNSITILGNQAESSTQADFGSHQDSDSKKFNEDGSIKVCRSEYPFEGIEMSDCEDEAVERQPDDENGFSVKRRRRSRKRIKRLLKRLSSEEEEKDIEKSSLNGSFDLFQESTKEKLETIEGVSSVTPTRDSGSHCRYDYSKQIDLSDKNSENQSALDDGNKKIQSYEILHSSPILEDTGEPELCDTGNRMEDTDLLEHVMKDTDEPELCDTGNLMEDTDLLEHVMKDTGEPELCDTGNLMEDTDLPELVMKDTGEPELCDTGNLMEDTDLREHVMKDTGVPEPFIEDTDEPENLLGGTGKPEAEINITGCPVEHKEKLKVKRIDCVASDDVESNIDVIPPTPPEQIEEQVKCTVKNQTKLLVDEVNGPHSKSIKNSPSCMQQSDSHMQDRIERDSIENGDKMLKSTFAKSSAEIESDEKKHGSGEFGEDMDSKKNSKKTTKDEVIGTDGVCHKEPESGIILADELESDIILVDDLCTQQTANTAQITNKQVQDHNREETKSIKSYHSKGIFSLNSKKRKQEEIMGKLAKRTKISRSFNKNEESTSNKSFEIIEQVVDLSSQPSNQKIANALENVQRELGRKVSEAPSVEVKADGVLAIDDEDDYNDDILLFDDNEENNSVDEVREEPETGVKNVLQQVSKSQRKNVIRDIESDTSFEKIKDDNRKIEADNDDPVPSVCKEEIRKRGVQWGAVHSDTNFEGGSPKNLETNYYMDSPRNSESNFDVDRPEELFEPCEDGMVSLESNKNADKHMTENCGEKTDFLDKDWLSKKGHSISRSELICSGNDKDLFASGDSAFEKEIAEDSLVNKENPHVDAIKAPVATTVPSFKSLVAKMNKLGAENSILEADGSDEDCDVLLKPSFELRCGVSNDEVEGYNERAQKSDHGFKKDGNYSSLKNGYQKIEEKEQEFLSPPSPTPPPKLKRTKTSPPELDAALEEMKKLLRDDNDNDDKILLADDNACRYKRKRSPRSEATGIKNARSNEKDGIDVAVNDKPKAKTDGHSTCITNPASGITVLTESAKETTNIAVSSTPTQARKEDGKKAPMPEREVLKTPIINSELRKKNLTQNNGDNQNGSAKDVTIIPSRLKRKEMSYCKAMADRMDCKFSTAYVPGSTHLVMGTDENLAIDRTAYTYKYLMALITGTWIVGFKWILACLKAGKHVAEENFEVKGDPSSNQELVPRIARIAKNKNEAPLFSQLSLSLLGDLKASQLSKDQLIQILEICGANVMFELPKIIPEKNYLLITDRESLEHGLASRCLESNIQPVHYEWIMESIINYKVQDPTLFLLNL